MFTNFDDNEVIDQFIDFMMTEEIYPRDTSFRPITDGQLHRFSVEDDRGRETSGAYFLHIDTSWPHGGAMDYHKHSNIQKFSYTPTAQDKQAYHERMKAERDQDRNLSPTQRQEAEKQRQSERAQEHQERQRQKEKELQREQEQQQQAARMALTEYLAANELSVIYHGYIKQRFIDTGLYSQLPYQVHVTRYEGSIADDNRIIYYPMRRCERKINGGCCTVGELLIPMINIATWKLSSLIRVAADHDNETGKFTRRYYPHAPIKGTAFILSIGEIKKPDRLFVCEGFGSALSAFILTGANVPVFSVGSCHNYVPVCEALRTRYDNAKIILGADHDKAGISAAEQCKRSGLVDAVKIPSIVGGDWFDELLSRFHGKEQRL